MVAGWGRSRTELAVSPDGARLVWSAEDTETRGTALYGLLLDRAEPMRVAGSDGATQPFFSPDGRWVGFYDARRGKLCRVPVEGGLAADLVDVKRPGPMGAFWSADGRIFLGNLEGGLEWTPAEGGSLRALTHVDRTREMGHRLPWVLPGGRVILFTAPLHGWGVRARVEAVSLTSGARKVLVEDAADARYLASGHLVFARQGSLMAAPFDPDRLELEAPPVPVLDDVRQALNMGNGLMNSGAAQFTVSATGLLVYAKGGILEDTPTELVLVDRVGRAERLPGFDKPLATGQVRFSPDGRQLAFTEAAHGGLAWLFDLERQTHRPLTHDGIAGWPVWSPDGGRIALGWSAAGPLSLWLVPAEGGGGWRRLTEEGGFPASWVPDGRALLFVRDTMDDDDILLCRIADGQVTSLLETRAEEKYPELSPDGRLLAYASNETGRREVFVTSFPDLRRTLVVSHSGGDSPVWSRDGRTLFYLDLDRPDRRLLGVPVIRAEPFALGAPTVLFRLPPGTRLSDPVRGYDVHPDGKRFLFARWKEPPLPPTPVTRLHLVENWFAELDRLSARGR